MFWLYSYNSKEPNFTDQFKKMIKNYKEVGYTMNVMLQSACQVVK